MEGAGRSPEDRSEVKGRTDAVPPSPTAPPASCGRGYNTTAHVELSFRAQQSEVEKSPSTMQLVVSEAYAPKPRCQSDICGLTSIAYSTLFLRRLKYHLPAGAVILNAVKNGRSANYKEGPFMCRLRANFGRLTHSLQNARRTSSKCPEWS